MREGFDVPQLEELPDDIRQRLENVQKSQAFYRISLLAWLEGPMSFVHFFPIMMRCLTLNTVSSRKPIKK